MLADALSAGRVAAVGPLRVRGLNGGPSSPPREALRRWPLRSTADGRPWL